MVGACDVREFMAATIGERDSLKFVYPVSFRTAGMHLFVEDDRIEVGFKSEITDSLYRLATSIDGVRTVEDLRRQNSLPREVISGFVAALHAEGMLVSEGQLRDFTTGGQLADLLARLYAHWNAQIFSHPLWTFLNNGSAPRALVDGWLIETYYFIRGANARLAYAIAECRDQRVRSLLRHHYVEEYDHYDFFREAIRRRGIDTTFLDERGPLPGTRAVINAARSAARRDALEYVACSGLLESTGSDANRGREFYRLLAANFDQEQSGFVEPMLRHVELDEGYGHGSVMRDVLVPIERLSIERANSVVSAGHDFAETVHDWFGDIVAYYRGCADTQLGRCRKYRTRT
jgi:hypothetical protein